jgi:phosphatidate phosphatase PAH1
MSLTRKVDRNFSEFFRINGEAHFEFFRNRAVENELVVNLDNHQTNSPRQHSIQ